MRDDLELRVPVLIVGAGPAGLTASILLAGHGVRSLVAERHETTSLLPRATAINVRTMEILRALDLEPAVRRAEVDVRDLPLMLEMETLNGAVLATVPNLNAGDPSVPGWPSPTRMSFCAQDVFEPILVEAARRSDLSSICFGTDVAGVEQDGGGVSAELRDLVGGTRRSVRADYLIAADGAHSQVREALGIGMTGRDISTEVNILFDADLSRALAGRRSVLYNVRNEWLPDGGLFRNNDGRHRWTLFTRHFGDLAPSRCIEIIRGCAGDPGLAVEILATGVWQKAALLADRFGAGRILLAGDAAHRLTPAGAMGMNTAIQDVHNLAWKLAAVLRGQAHRTLLDTYETERRPVASRSVDLSYEIEIANPRGRGNVLGHVLGAAYEHGALVPDRTPASVVADPVAEYVPSARPGQRAPHCWLSLDGRRSSTIDLFDGSFVLLTSSERWCRAAREAAAALELSVLAQIIPDPGWATLYGVGQEGAVLVRPDGYVAWRTRDASDDMVGEVERILGTVLHRDLLPKAT